MKVVKMDEAGMRLAIEALRKGGLVVYPTETVYGLGADAASEEAVAKIWEFKGERGDKPVLVAVGSREMMHKYIEIDSLMEKVGEKYLPGAVSILGRDRGLVCERVLGGSTELGVRMPKHDWCLEMIGQFGGGITSTSVNLSGEKPIRSLAEFERVIPVERQKLVDVFVDGGELPESLPSTLVKSENGQLVVLRQGAILVEI